jgi:DNA-binding Xre family transcriptional regulator
MLIDHGMKRTDLKTVAHISGSTLAKLGRNEYVALEVLARIATVLQCQIGDLVALVDDQNMENEDEERE